jgi:cyclic lactone autoinducer peptide
MRTIYKLVSLFLEAVATSGAGSPSVINNYEPEVPAELHDKN